MPYKDKARQKEYQNTWVKARNAGLRIWLAEYKLEKGCIDCGYNENSDALEFDHVRGKKANIGALVPAGKNAVLKELEKCEVRCANCHAIITAKRRRGEA